MRKTVWIPVIMMWLCACQNTTYVSSVPNATVNLRINTNTGEYVHFVQGQMGQYTYVDDEGFHYNEKIVRNLTLSDRYGYGGVLIYDDGTRYTAYDMACPKCLHRTKHIVVDGFYAICPLCHEQYDCSCGVGNPTQGICKEGLKRYALMYSGGYITIVN